MQCEALPRADLTEEHFVMRHEDPKAHCVTVQAISRKSALSKVGKACMMVYPCEAYPQALSCLARKLSFHLQLHKEKMHRKSESLSNSPRTRRFQGGCFTAWLIKHVVFLFHRVTMSSACASTIRIAKALFFSFSMLAYEARYNEHWFVSWGYIWMH